MTTSGQTIYKKITTDKIIFLKTRKDTNAVLLKFDNYQKANGIGPVAHRHPLQEEKFRTHKDYIKMTIMDKNRMSMKDSP